MMPEPDTLTAEDASILEEYERIDRAARAAFAQRDEAHALLFRIAYGEKGVTPRPLAGGVLIEIKALLERHGVVAVPAETTTRGEEA